MCLSGEAKVASGEGAHAALKDVAAGGKEEMAFEPVGLTLCGGRVEDTTGQCNGQRSPHQPRKEPIA
jgi:hypothetical protein